MMRLSDYAGPGYGIQAYSKAPIALYALGGIVGDSAVDRAFAEYTRAWKYKHATPYDFFFSMNHSLKRNLDWFWHAWFFTTYTVDQSIESVMASGDQAVITVRDKGDMAMPVIARVEFADGSTSELKFGAERWFSGLRTMSDSFPLRGKVLRKVTLDPENRFQDLDRSNNVWPRN